MPAEIPPIVATPKLSASLILLRDAETGPQVLLVERRGGAGAFAAAWVFPGGLVEEGETPQQAAIRETAEEVGVEFDGELHELSIWLTPERVARRFNTHFYVAQFPHHQTVRIDENEIVNADWFAVAEVEALLARPDFKLLLPTYCNLKAIEACTSVAEALEQVKRYDVRSVMPCLEMDGDEKMLVIEPLPWLRQTRFQMRAFF